MQAIIPLRCKTLALKAEDIRCTLRVHTGMPCCLSDSENDAQRPGGHFYTITTETKQVNARRLYIITVSESP